MSANKQRRRPSVTSRRSGLHQTPPTQSTPCPESEDESEYSSCPSPLLQIEGGYRVDPFTVYPIQASHGVKHMADYYIQIWAPQQAQAIRLGRSKNALLSLILPEAFRDAMLFHATIAMTRAAWLLRKGMTANDDKSLLKHRGMALKKLRNLLMTAQLGSSEALLLTMSTLLTMNYMLSEVEPFHFHLQALSKMMENTSSQSSNIEVNDFVRGRVMAFSALSSFMSAHQPLYANRVNEPGHRISSLTYPSHPFSPDLCSLISSIPPGFAELALSRSLSIELISFLARLTNTLSSLSNTTSTPCTSSPVDSKTAARPGIPKKMTLQRAIYDLQCLLALPLTTFEVQLSQGLVAFCFVLYNATSTGCSKVALDAPLTVVTNAFNAHPDPPPLRARWLRRCLMWCSLVISSARLEEADEDDVDNKTVKVEEQIMGMSVSSPPPISVPLSARIPVLTRPLSLPPTQHSTSSSSSAPLQTPQQPNKNVILLDRLLLTSSEMRQWEPQGVAVYVDWQGGGEGLGGVQGIMKQFFWHDALQGRWKQCWDFAMARTRTLMRAVV